MGVKASITVPEILGRKSIENVRKISCITAYDFTTAKLFDQAGIDLILVGDSLGTVIQGHPTTLPVTLDHMVYHCQCVVRGVRHALVVGDLPFLSYQVSIERAIESAGRLIKEGGVSAVKLEGGVPFAQTVSRLVELDIPVVGHVGLTPQSFHRMGGNKVQGRHAGSQAGSRARVLEDARTLEQAGAFAVVVEGVPLELAREITETLSIPTIGIGSGPYCDGQILVGPDLLGMNPEFKPKFLKRYGSLGEEIVKSVKTYISEIEGGVFPTAEHCLSEERSLKIVASKKEA